jgi:hypothetical protein
MLYKIDFTQHSLNENKSLQSLLKHLCVPIDKAQIGDIIALNITISASRSQVNSVVPSGVLVKQSNTSVISKPWYDVSLSHKIHALSQTTEQFQKECLSNIEQQLFYMAQFYNKYDNFSFIVIPGSSAIVRNKSEDFTLHTETEIQNFIRDFASFCIPESKSAHNIIATELSLKNLEKILTMYAPLIHPKTGNEIHYRTSELE